jgi:hypothetical protein
MSHTIYAANENVSHIHRRMCEWDYTIDKSSTKRKKEVMLELEINILFMDDSFRDCFVT